MTTTVLNNDQHRSLAVDTRASVDYGDQVNRALALSSEFGELHKEFPILLYKSDDAAGFVGHAILGFEKDENLFVEGERWITQCMPATLARGPFSLGYVPGADDSAAPADVKIMVDDSHPRLRADGQPVFLPLGGETPYLQGIKRVLQTIDAGLLGDRLLYPELVAMNLLEEINIQVSVFVELNFNFKGYYTVNQEKFAALNGEQLYRLHRLGLLAPVHFLISSLSNFQRLINLKTARLQAA